MNQTDTPARLESSSGYEGAAALDRLMQLAQSNRQHAADAANFLLAWKDAGQNGGWDPRNLWTLSNTTAGDILVALAFLREYHENAEAAYREQLQQIQLLWRAPR